MIIIISYLSDTLLMNRVKQLLDNFLILKCFKIEKVSPKYALIVNECMQCTLKYVIEKLFLIYPIKLLT